MRRRAFLTACVAAALLPLTGAAAAANKTFIITLRDRSGKVGKVTIMAKDAGAALAQVKKKYPGAQVINVQQR